MAQVAFPIEPMYSAINETITHREELGWRT